MMHQGEIIHLNVGGRKFSTLYQTLSSTSFFESLLREPTNRDETGAIFLDRDPHVFRVILNFLRTGEIDLNSTVDSTMLLREAKHFGIIPLIERLELDLDEDNWKPNDITKKPTRPLYKPPSMRSQIEEHDKRFQDLETRLNFIVARGTILDAMEGADFKRLPREAQELYAMFRDVRNVFSRTKHRHSSFDG